MARVSPVRHRVAMVAAALSLTLITGATTQAACPLETRIIDDDAQLQQHGRMVRHADGRLLIVYPTFTASRPELYYCDDPECRSGTGHILPDVVSGLGQSLAAVLRADGRPMLSMLDDVNDDYRLFSCDDAGCTAGHARIPEPGVTSGFSGDMTLGASGSPLVSYRRGTPSQLWLYRCTDADCDNGTGQVIDSRATAVGINHAMALRADGSPFFAHHDTAMNGQLRVSVCEGPDCQTISHRVIGRAALGAIDVVMRSDDRAVIAYYAIDGGFRPHLYFCANALCTSGESRRVDAPPSSIESALELALEIGPQGAPVLVHTGSRVPDAVTLYECASEACTLGESRVIAETAGETYERGLALEMGDPEGPTVLFGESTTRELRLMKCAVDVLMIDGFEAP